MALYDIITRKYIFQEKGMIVIDLQDHCALESLWPIINVEVHDIHTYYKLYK